MSDVSVVLKEPDERMAAMDPIDFSFAMAHDANDSFSFSLPKGRIEVVKRYKNWCVLSVARGNGPRAVEEWISSNESLCFDHPLLAYSTCSDSDGNSDKGLNEADQEQEQEQELKPSIQTTGEDDVVISPVLVNPHNAACAHSLLLAARHPSCLQQLRYLRVTAHCLIKGYHRPGTEIQLANVMEGRRCRTTAICLEVVPSNSVGHISLLVAYNDQEGSTFIAPRQFQRHLQAGGWPVLGGTRDCHTFRGEKMCMSVVGLDFEATGSGMERRQSISIPPVPKLRSVLEKEERFWRQRQGVDDVRVELFGNELPKPTEYVDEKAMFDGLEFRVTPEVMIPRKGTEAILDIVEAFVENTKSLSKELLVLDLGTGCGNLLLAILKRLCHLHAKGIGLDMMREALQLCDYNIAALGMKDYAKSVQGRFADIHMLDHDPFHIVVCNPPYMTKGGRRILDAVTTSYEPERALFVERQDPNIHYRHVLDGLTRGNLLVPGALLVFEVCKENAEAIMQLMVEHGLLNVTMGRDWKSCIRTVHGIFNPCGALSIETINS